VISCAPQIKGVLKACEKTNTDTESIRFDDRSFSLCCDSLVPVYRNQNSVQCPYCRSVYVPANDGTLCSTCQLAKIGAQADGLVFLKI
jgi:uncharacterized Zn-finger protein